MKIYNEQQLFADQVEYVYSNQYAAYLATLINGAILTYILRNVVPVKTLLSWFIVLCTITLIRYIIFISYKKSTQQQINTNRYAILLILGMFFSGLVWGSTGIVLFAEHSASHQIFVAFVIGGMVAGASVTSSGLQYAFVAFSIPALLPIILRFFYIGGEIQTAMGIMTVVYTISVYAIAFNIHARVITSLKLRQENRQEVLDRKRAEEELRRHQEHLESVVRQRTEALEEINKKLTAEIMERRIAVEDLYEIKELYRSLVENIDLGITLVDLDYNIVMVNKAQAANTAKNATDLIGKKCYREFEGRDSLCPYCPGISAMKSGQLNEIENEGIHDNGERFIRRIRAFPVIGKDKISRGFIRLVEDITERRKIDDERQRSQKLESIGILAGGIAHDFNNLLAGILGNISLAKMYLQPEDEAFKKLYEAEKGFSRAKSLTRQLLTFSKGGGPVIHSTTISDIIIESVTFVLHGSNVKSDYHLPDDLWPVKADKGQINQVVHNIALNAVQAMPEGGIISITGRNIITEEKSQLPLKAGMFVEIAIEDQGPGIPEKNLSKIFDPYFTTKQQGNGLGLAISHSIIKKHLGHITVESRVDNGAKFIIYLPASIEKPISDETNPDAINAGTGKILVLDDEEYVLETVGNMLNYLGYESVLVTDGEKAVISYKQALENNTPFTAVIMDLTIPGGKGGRVTLSKMLELDSGVKAIVSSGYANDPIMANYEEFGFKAVATKPYSIQDLGRVLHEVKA